MEQLYDIREVCEMLGTTSRTLRFYEEKGLISGTKCNSLRRKYTERQIIEIQKVLKLRAIGVSIKGILEYQNAKGNLKGLLELKIAQTVAEIRSAEKKLELLCEAKEVVLSGGNVFSIDIVSRITLPSEQRRRIVEECTECMLERDLTPVLKYFCDRMRNFVEHTTVPTFEDMTASIGKFIAIDKCECDPNTKNIVFHYLRYEKIGLRIKYVFRDDIIHGYWLDYYEL